LASWIIISLCEISLQLQTAGTCVDVVINAPAVCSSDGSIIFNELVFTTPKMCRITARFSGSVLLLLAMLVIICHGANQYEVIAGKDNGEGFVAMQFFPPRVIIQAGDSVRFVVQGDGHTVVFYKQLVDYVDFATLVVLPSGRVQGDAIVRSNETLYSTGLLLQDESYTFTFPVAGMCKLF
jgi:plastocyanin